MSLVRRRGRGAPARGARVLARTGAPVSTSVAALPLLDGFGPDDDLLVDGTIDAVSATGFCGAALRLARRLPSGPYAINRCEDRTRFLLGSAAVLAAGHTLILPPSRGAEVEGDLQARYPGAYAIADAPAMPGAIPTVVPDAGDLGGAAHWPPPAIAAEQVAAILFTSGSTGAPAAQPKRWSALVRGARTFVGSFGPLPGDAVIVGTVAPQHMFGLETTVLLPWQTGTPVDGRRPLYPADLATCAAGHRARGRRVWLMTTPLHLRAFHAAMAEPPRLAQVVVSTMPLPIELACDVERDWGVAVGEIYGCTEGGMLATRRPARDATFTPGAGLTATLAADGRATLSGGHLDAALVTADRFLAVEDGSQRLRLVGRDRDIVKIAGKRTTLAALSAALASIPGVRDAAYVPAAAEAVRLAALVVAPGHDAQSLRTALAARVDRAFLPRPLAFVAALPRDAQGKLAAAALQAALDEALRVPGARPDRVLCSAGAVPHAHPAFAGHFPGRPILPGVLLLERVERLLREHGLAVAAVDDASFARAVEPGARWSVRVELGDDARARFRVEVDGEKAAAGTLRTRPSA